MSYEKYLSKKRKLFCIDNAKTTKGEKHGYSTIILYLAAANMSGVVNVCKHATKECREDCLVTAGLAGIYPKINQSRIYKTQWMHEYPDTFWSRVDIEIRNHEKLCERNSKRLKRKMKPCVRINGTSDIWNTDMQTIMYRHPDVQFYDYSKDFKRIVDWSMGKMPLNYHLTYSYGGGDAKNAIWCLDNGVNVAVVFDVKRGDKLPDHHWGFTVVDGDTHDLRFLDQKDPNKYGRIIGLRAKGKAAGKEGRSNSFIQKGNAS
jgi:hypothetical protein